MKRGNLLPSLGLSYRGPGKQVLDSTIVNDVYARESPRETSYFSRMVDPLVVADGEWHRKTSAAYSYTSYAVSYTLVTFSFHVHR